jgi:superfamily I DNA/RNA helicase
VVSDSAVPPYLRGLNPEQLRAALAIEGPVLVLAGAGSGKTRTLVHRIVHLVRGAGVDPRQIVAVTFTNRAADEMRARARAALGREGNALTLSTFHALGARILRSHGERAGLPKDFAIYATGEQVALVRRILAEEVGVQATAGDDRFDPKRILWAISDWKNRLVSPEQARAEVMTEEADGTRRDDYAVLAADAYPRYEEALRAAGACDFDDLLLHPLRLLETDAEVREALWRRWRYLMIDEYQDTNAAQLALARQLAGPHRNLCVVGDDDQAIYGWRGADVRNILDFERHFPGAEVVILEQNYRSTQRILDIANAVIAGNAHRTPKEMRTEGVPGPRADYWEFEDEEGRSAEEHEAAMIAREVGIRRFRENLPWGAFAVLYRANHLSRPVEEALRAANIPYRVLGGTSWFDRREIADALAYLRLAANPRDEISLRRIVNTPTRGIGRTTQLRLLEHARARRIPLFEAMKEADGVEGLTAAAVTAVGGFVKLVEGWRRQLPGPGEPLPPPGQPTPLERWAGGYLRETGLEEAIRDEHRASPRAAEIRVDNVRDLIASVGRWERQQRDDAGLPDEEEGWEPEGLAGFLASVSLTAEVEEGETKEEPGGEAVTLMTLHAAKGLEFTHVFLIGLEEELLPHARSLQDPETGSPRDAIAEERRLFYVGVTRARHRLTMSSCRVRRQRGEAIRRLPSRFLAEVPPELVERRGAAREEAGGEEESKELREDFFSRMKEMLG